jgi:hypothetical protein
MHSSISLHKRHLDPSQYLVHKKPQRKILLVRMYAGHVSPKRRRRGEVNVWTVAVEVAQLVDNEGATLRAVRRRKDLKAF